MTHPHLAYKSFYLRNVTPMKKNAPRRGIQRPSVFHLTNLSFVTSFISSSRRMIRYGK